VIPGTKALLRSPGDCHPARGYHLRPVEMVQL
jgi:hypothetical protein